jgi:phage tail-like protein
MVLGQRRDPYRDFNFLVEIDGVTGAGFSEVSGLQTETEVFEYREGGLNTYIHKLPTQTKYSNIILKRGVTDSAELWQWQNKAAQGKVERKSGSIILLNERREEKVRWNFREGWPTKWVGPDLKADGKEVAIEILEIAHEGIERA